MRNRSDIEGFISELIGKPKVELESRDRKFLIKLLRNPESVYSMTKSINQKFKVNLALVDGNTPLGRDASHNVFYITSGPLSRPAVYKRIKKLVRYGLIKEVDKKSLTGKKRFDANLRHAKPYRVTEYGLFCMLSEVVRYQPSGLFWRYWRSKVMRVFLSSYFEKKTVLHPTTAMYFTIAHFLIEACIITTRRLSQIEEAIKENDETERQGQITKLEDDLVWHAKSFALRLMVDSAARNKDKRHTSRIILSDLAHDKKFVKLADTAVRDILSYYKGGELLRR
jgi:hypothetical protein